MTDTEQIDDTERIDALEQLLWGGSIGNGIAIFPCTDKTGRRMVSLTDLGDEDGSSLGEDLSTSVTLRDAIDSVIRDTKTKSFMGRQ